jgi:diguanylate cyclase (GGDEF)-like protein/PAS domain S-box-containing protein
MHPTKTNIPFNMTHPPWLDRRFWITQLLVLLVCAIHLSASLAEGHELMPVPELIWILPMLVPIVRAGLVFGLVGSLSTALIGIVAMAPADIVLPDPARDLWGASSVYAIALIIAIVVGVGVDRLRMTIEIRTAAEVLAREDERLHLAFEDSTRAVAVTDLDANILRTNRSLCDMLGRSNEELIGTSILDYSQLDDRESTGAVSQKLAVGKTERLSYVKRLVRKDGEVVHVEMSRSVVKDGRDVPIYVVASLRDLTIERTAERRIVESEQRFRLAFTGNMAGMVLHDRQGHVIDANEALCQMVGYSVHEIAEHGSSLFIHPEEAELAVIRRQRFVSGEDSSTRVVTRYIHKDGKVVHVEVSRSVATDENGEPVFIVTSIRDITAERALAAQLSHQAMHDSLTGLPNRVLLEDRVIQARSRIVHHGGYNALLLLDVDDFKGVNDIFGHHAGDQFLIALSHRLEKVTRYSDTLSRFASDEFVYLAEELDGASDAEELAKRLLGALDEPFVLDQCTVERSASIGVVVWDATTDEGYDQLMQDADTAMYEAKRQGMASYVLYTSDMSERASSGFKLAQELGQAITNGELSMHYQPLVELSSGRIVGYEALMRWQHPTLGLLSPEVFMALLTFMWIDLARI